MEIKLEIGTRNLIMRQLYFNCLRCGFGKLYLMFLANRKLRLKMFRMQVKVFFSLS